MEGINLTPQQEIKRRRTHYVVGAATKISIFITFVTLCVAGYYFYTTSKVNSQISDLEQKKSDLNSQISGMSDIENLAKKLSGKYFLLQKYLESRLKYSSVILELTSRVPDGVSFESLNFEGVGKRARLSGKSKDTVSISYFVAKLSKQGNASEDSGANLEGKNAFSDIRLESLNVNKDKTATYVISFKINEEAFLK